MSKKIANDVWRASSPPGVGDEEYEASRTVVNLWWGAWLVAVLLERGVSATYDRASALDGIRDAAVLGVGADVLYVLASVAAVAFVRRLTAMQEARSAEYLTGPPAAHLPGGTERGPYGPRQEPLARDGAAPQPPASH